MRKSITGFTIVELLIVIVVIAILAAITIVAYSGIQSQAQHSARLSATSQAQKQIQVEALQHNGVTLSLKAPLAYTAEAGVEVPLTSPLETTKELTLYVVFDTTGNVGSNYTELVRLTPNPGSNNVFLRTSTGNFMGSRIDTSAQTNVTGQDGASIRNTAGRHIGWITIKEGSFYLDYDGNDEGTSAPLSAHSGFTFNAIRLNTNTSITGVATLAFPEYHDQTTRQQVLEWLDRKYTIENYS